MEFSKKNFTTIPKIFQSDSKGGFFDHCISCDRNLLDRNTDYLVEKALKSYNGLKAYATLFEYAMCWDCVEKMQASLSEESRARMAAYFKQHMDMETRSASLQSSNYDVGHWLDQCVISQAKASGLREFQIYGHCRGNHLVFHHYPFMIGGPVLDEITDLLSNATLDALQNFTDQLTDGPSEFADLFKVKPRIVL